MSKVTTDADGIVSVFGLGSNFSQEERIGLRKNNLVTLLDSYADEADVFAEILQNAVDSVLTAQLENLYSSGANPELIVFIGRRSQDQHYFCVSDNGLGMEPHLAEAFTQQGMTAKKRKGKTIGHKGVGASFFVAASEKFTLETCAKSGTVTKFTVDDSYSWVRNQTSPLPEVKPDPEFPSAVTKHMHKDRGTTVCYYFHNSWKPTSLSHIVRLNSDDPEKEIGNWASYFCSKTSLGQIHDISTNNINVKFVLDLGDDGVHEDSWTIGVFDRAKKQLGYAYPHRVFQVAKNVADIDKLGIPQRDHLRNTLQAIRMRWDRDFILNELKPAIDLEHAEENLVNEHLDFVELFFAYSTDVMEEVKNRLGERTSAFRYGIRIAVDGIPQGRMMDFSLTSNQGLDRQMHALLAFKDLTLDTGRKIPSDELISEVVRKLSTRLASHVKDYRLYLKKKDAPPPSHNLDDWRKQITTAQSTSLSAQLFEVNGKEPPIRVDPQNEQDTIALFCGLVSAGLINGLKLASLSGYNAYDGLINVDNQAPELTDPNEILSVRTSAHQRAGQLKVVEFKHTFHSVLDDFDSKKKDPKDIDILICWELPSMAVRRGSFDYWYEDKTDLREVYAATHVWRDDNNSTDMVIVSLKHVVGLLLAYKERSLNKPGLGVATETALFTQDKQSSI